MFSRHSGRCCTFTSPATWLPGWRPVTAGEAGPRLLRSYLAAYAPATLDDFGQWLFRGVARASLVRGWLAAVRDELSEVDVDGVRALARTADLDSDPRRALGRPARSSQPCG